MKLLISISMAVYVFTFSSVVNAEADNALKSVYNPTFISGEEEYSAGKGFITNFENSTIFITALHLIGEAGGFQKDYVGDEVSDVVTELVATNIVDNKIKVVSNKVITLKGTEPVSDARLNGDVAAFLIESNILPNTLPLSLSNPKIQDTLFMLSSVYGSDKKVHKAMVVESNDGYIAYVFEDKTISLRATSGAPLVNLKGEVVAINISGGENQGYLVGYGNPSTGIASHLEHAIQIKP
jgi:hypothetical protein